MKNLVLNVLLVLLGCSLVLVLPTTAASIHVTWFNGGENIYAGDTQTITWTQTGLTGTNVQINLYKQVTGHLPNGIPFSIDVFQYTIAASVPAAQESYTWPITNSQTPGGHYRLEVKSLSNSAIYDRSDNYFIINGIQVTSPNGNENWQAGSTHAITWNEAGYGSSQQFHIFQINLYKQVTGHLPNGIPFSKDVFQSTIANGVSSAEHFYSWKIPASLPSGNSYRIEVKCNNPSFPAMYDRSDKTFSITSSPAATITVTSPRDETWQPGTSHLVTWKYTGNPGPYVKVVLLRDDLAVGTATYSTSIGSGGAGSYLWTISSTRAPGTYQILVQSTTDPSVKGTSYFTIGQGGTTTPTITVTSPNGGEIWKRGTSHTVTWKFAGNPGSTVKIELLQGGTPVGTATYSTSIGSGGTGSYLWTISSGRAAGTNYRIRVTSVSQPSVSDTSNGDFTITI